MTEAIVVIQARGQRLGPGGSENGENQINLGYILEIKPTGYGGKLNMGEKKKKESKKRIWFEQLSGYTEIRKTRDRKRSDWK